MEFFPRLRKKGKKLGALHHHFEKISKIISNLYCIYSLPNIFSLSGKKAADKDSDVIGRFVLSVTINNLEDDEDCIICMDNLKEASGFAEGHSQERAKEVVKLTGCGHTFHRLCLLAMYKNDNKVTFLFCFICVCFLFVVFCCCK